MSRIAPVLGLSAAALAISASSAFAIDYGALEEVFGEPVTTSATGAPQRATEAPVNMTIITQDEIVRSGAIDIVGVLERFASIDVDRHARGTPEVSVRGYNGPNASRLLVLVNNRQVYLDTYGSTVWDLIPVELSEIRQIEVIKGPNTALFGLNAVGGVVNIITYDPINDDRTEVAGRVGEPRYVQGSAVVTVKPMDNLGLRVSLGAFDQDPFNRDPTRIEPYRNSASASAAWDVTPMTRVDGEATWSANQRWEPYSGSVREYEQNSFKLGVSHDTSIGTVAAQVYSNWAALVLETYSATAPPRRVNQYDNRVTVGSVSLLSKPAAAHTTRITAEYRNNSLKPNDRINVNYDVASIAGMWNWAISETFATTTAVRLDQLQLQRSGPSAPGYPFTNEDFDQDLSMVGGNLGAVWRLTDIDTLRLAAARGVQSPGLTEFGLETRLSAGPPPSFLAGDPSLDPTTVTQVELGWDRKLSVIPASLRASVYWQRTDDLKALSTSIVTVEGATLNKSENFGDSELTGIDLELRGNQGPWFWFAEWSHREYEDTITLPGIIGFENSSPNDIVTAGVDMIGERFEYGVSLRNVGEMDGLSGPRPRYNARVNNYTQANLRFAWKPADKLMLEISGRDLLEPQTTTTPIGPVERSVYFTLRKSL